MPYDRWTIVDTKWLVGLALIMMWAKSISEFQAGIIFAIIIAMWVNNRNNRRREWHENEQRKLELEEIEDLNDD